MADQDSLDPELKLSPGLLATVADQQLLRANIAVGRVASATALVLAEGDLVGFSDEQQSEVDERLASIINNLASLVGMSIELAGDIAERTGINLEEALRAIGIEGVALSPNGSAALPVASSAVEPEGTEGGSPKPELDIDPETLAAEILPVNMFPDVDSESDSIVARILTDKMVAIDGREISLENPLNMFAFNVLMLLREDPISAERMKTFGFAELEVNSDLDKSKTDQFNRRLKLARDNIIECINSAAGKKIITETGAARGTRYHVDACLQLVDNRQSAEAKKNS